jgi:hypothetical protein
MANKKNHLGKVIRQIQGYAIRPVLDSKGNPIAEVGLYKGKELITSVPYRSMGRLEVIVNGIINRRYQYRKYWYKNCK